MEPDTATGTERSLDDCLLLLEDRLDELKQAIVDGSPGIPGAALRVREAFKEVQRLAELAAGLPPPSPEITARRRPRFETLLAKTLECIRLLEKAKAETEVRSAALRKKQKALSGYRKCNRMN